MFVRHTGRLSFDASSRVNAVETLFSAFPAFMYIDPSLGAPLLEPLFRLQASSDYSIQYAAADLGASSINPISEIFRIPCRIKLPECHELEFYSQSRSRTSVPLTLTSSISHLSPIESGNMLTMTYAHARATGDGSLISKYVCQDSNIYWQGLIVFESIRC